jgi:hypothetical protein
MEYSSLTRDLADICNFIASFVRKNPTGIFLKIKEITFRGISREFSP